MNSFQNKLKYISPKNLKKRFGIVQNKVFILSKDIRKRINNFDSLSNSLSLRSSKLLESFQDKIERFQDKIERIVEVDKSQVILKQSRFWASAITWSLMGATGFAIGWLAIAKTDEVVIAMGKLEPKGGVVDVQMPLEGVTKKIFVKEGEKVKKGQVLMLLDTEITETRNESLKNSLKINKDILNRLKLLVEEGAVSEVQYLQQKEKYEEIKSKIKSNLVTLKYQEIISPIDGIVFDLEPKGAGYVARTSQSVLKIVPMDNLIAKVEIDNRTIGFVKPGKLAEISIDSFPARNFGVIEGEVISIGSDAIPPSPSEGKGYRFNAEIKLKNQYIKLKSGTNLSLQTGMSLTANIKLRKVTYLQLLLNQFTDRAESLRSI